MMDVCPCLPGTEGLYGTGEGSAVIDYFYCKQVHAYIEEDRDMEITGAELLVKALQCEQVDTLFAYPGGQAVDLFHALRRAGN